MPVEFTTPVVVPAVAEKTFQYVWFTHISIYAQNPVQPASVTVSAVPYDGAATILPQPIEMKIDDLFAASEYDPTQVGALETLLASCSTKQIMGLAQVVIYAALQAYGKDIGSF